MLLVALCRLAAVMPAHEAFPVVTVHDMIGFQIRDEYVSKWVPIIRSTMQDVDILYKWFGAEITVPIEAEIKVGQYWGAGEVV